jgi:6-phosphogluconolactonase
VKIDKIFNATDLRSTISRRTLMKASAVFAFSCVTLKAAVGLSGRKTLAYVGTDTSPVDGTANGKGIYLFEMDSATGELSLIKLVAQSANPTWITVHPSGSYLYASNEVSDYKGKSGSVSAFAIDRASGDLQFLNTVDSQGASPAYLSIDDSGRYAFVANYFGGSIAVLPILPNGMLGPAVDVHQDEGHLGSESAASGPAGSFAISGHDAPHAHMIRLDPSNRFALQTDLGQDRIYVYRFDRATGRLSPGALPFVAVPSGNGPRHFAFHPNGKWMYSVQEEASNITFFLFDPETGALHPEQTVSALPHGFTGTNFCSEIMLSEDGRILYVANRLHNSIAVFRVGPRGLLSRVGEAMTLGDYPSHFNLDPSGNFLYVCNQRSDQITSFRINKATGLLRFTGQYVPIGTPLCITFLT